MIAERESETESGISGRSRKERRWERESVETYDADPGASLNEGSETRCLLDDDDVKRGTREKG
jgi:hypothetical protein